MTARELKNGNANVMLTISIAGVEQLNGVMNKLKKINSVISVDRTGK
jgi:GTP pyrophosphokinase